MQIEASVIFSDCVGGCCFEDFWGWGFGYSRVGPLAILGVGALVILGFGALLILGVRVLLILGFGVLVVQGLLLWLFRGWSFGYSGVGCFGDSGFWGFGCSGVGCFSTW